MVTKAGQLVMRHINEQLPRPWLFRELFAHDGWRVPCPADSGGARPTIIIADAAMTPTMYAFSDDEAYQSSCKALTAEAIGPTAIVRHLEDLIADLDPRITAIRIDPSSPISLSMFGEELTGTTHFAQAVRVERAMREERFSLVRAYDRYVIPYFGELGKGHNFISLPSPYGNMIAAFTAHDAVDAFLAAGNDESRAAVKLVRVDGPTLFGDVAGMAQGVIVNNFGPKAFGFDAQACRKVLAA
jgi:hypothetical protein